MLSTMSHMCKSMDIKSAVLGPYDPLCTFGEWRLSFFSLLVIVRCICVYVNHLAAWSKEYLSQGSNLGRNVMTSVSRTSLGSGI